MRGHLLMSSSSSNWYRSSEDPVTKQERIMATLFLMLLKFKFKSIEKFNAMRIDDLRRMMQEYGKRVKDARSFRPED